MAPATATLSSGTAARGDAQFPTSFLGAGDHDLPAMAPAAGRRRGAPLAPADRAGRLRDRSLSTRALRYASVRSRGPCHATFLRGCRLDKTELLSLLIDCQAVLEGRSLRVSGRAWKLVGRASRLTARELTPLLVHLSSAPIPMNARMVSPARRTGVRSSQVRLELRRLLVRRASLRANPRGARRGGW